MSQKALQMGSRILGFLEKPPIKLGFLALSLIAMGFFLVSQWELVEESFNSIHWPYVIAAALPGMAFVFTGVLIWTAILVRMAPSIAPNKLTRSFFLGQLSKYLPGGFWNFVSVSAFARSSGATRKELFLSQFFAVLTSIGTGLTLGGGLLIVSGRGGAGMILLGSTFVISGVGVVIAVVFASGGNAGVVRPRAVQFRKSFTSANSLVAASWALLGWVFAGVHVAFLALALETSLTFSMLLTVFLGFSIAWSLGAATPFAPSGIGVREAIFFAFVSLHLSVEASFIVVALSRIVLSLVDLVFGIVFWAYPRMTGLLRRKQV